MLYQTLSDLPYPSTGNWYWYCLPGCRPICMSPWGLVTLQWSSAPVSTTPVAHHGFSFMDKQLLLRAVRLTQCRLVPYIANTVLCWQHFSRLVPAVPGASVEHGCTYLDPHWIQLFRIIPNFLKLLKPHQSQPLLEVWIFAITQWLYLSH